MSEQTGPNQPPVDNPPPEDRESADRRNFETLRRTYEHYMGNQLVYPIGFVHHFIIHPDFPKGEHHQKIAKSLDSSSRIMDVTHNVLAKIQSDDKIKKGGGQFLFDIDLAIRAGLAATGDVGPQTKSEDWKEDEKIPDKFTIYKNTIGYYIGHVLIDPRFNLEALEEELRGSPVIYQMIQKAHTGILWATAIKEEIGNLSPDAEQSENQALAWYKLDDNINARFEKIQQDYLEHRKPD